MRVESEYWTYLDGDSDLKVECKTSQGKTHFFVSDVAKEYNSAMMDLNFQAVENGYARSFPATSRDLIQIYKRFSIYAEEMILQTAGVIQPRRETALDDVVERIESENVDWWLTGSAALAIQDVSVVPIQDVSVVPSDIDLVTTSGGAQELSKLMSDWLVEPIQESEDWIARWSGRAFHLSRIEWVADVQDWVDRPEASDFGLELQLRSSERRGLTERASKIRTIMPTRSK